MKISSSPRSVLPLILVLVIATIFFILSGFVFKGSLNNISYLSSEIASPEALYKYSLAEKAPFKYRMLFSSLVQLTYNIFSEPKNNQNFYIIYCLWSGLSYIAAAVSFYILLITLKFSRQHSIWGLMLFLLCPAVLFGYSLPVHSREDFLAYTILNISLIFIIRNNFKGVLCFAFLGILCRETLLIIPFLYLFFTTSKWIHKALVVSICFVVFFLIRFISGYESYNFLDLGFFYNLQNIEESIGFIFLVFSFMWPVYLYDLYAYFQYKKNIPKDPLTFLRKSSLAVFILILSTTIIGGRINEIRLMFLLFPWVIPIFLFYVKSLKISFYNAYQTRGYKIYLLICACSIIPLYVIASENITLFTEGIFAVPYNQWIIVTCIHLFILCSSIPIYIEMFKTFPSSNFHPLPNNKY